MAAEVLLVLLVGVGVTVALYLAIRAETRDLPRMDRDEAERRAREEGRRYNRRDADDVGRESDGRVPDGNDRP